MRQQPRLASLGFAATLLLFAVSIPAVSNDAGRWFSYVDPSLMSGIVSRDGELYIASSGGLVIYDPAGPSYEQFTNTIGLPSNFLTCLTFDHLGNLYVGTEEAGIARLEFAAGGFNVVALNSTFHGLSDDRITSLAAWGDTLVYGTKGGAGLIIEGFPGTRFIERDGLPSDVVTDVLADDDRVWIATDSGIVYLDKFGFITDVSEGLPDLNAKSLARTDTAVWAGTGSGLAYLANGTTQWIPAGLETESIFSLVFDRGVLWAGSRARIYRNDGSGSDWVDYAIFAYYSKYNLNNRISEIKGLYPMPDGTMYFGAGDFNSQRRGVNLLHFDGDTVDVDIAFNTLPANTLVRTTFDVDQSLWVSTTTFGVAKLTPSGMWFGYNPAAGDDNLASQFNLGLLADSQGMKWFGTLSYPEDQPEPKPLNQLEDQLDLIYENDVWTEYRIDDGGGDGLGTLRFVDAVEDPAGNRWFLSDEDQENAPGWWGINILSNDGGEWRRVNPTSTDPSGNLGGMKAGNVSGVAFGEDGLVYVALREYGVQFWVTGGYEPETLFDFTDDSWGTVATIGQQGGFDPTADILSVELADDGVLWIGTTVGLYRYERTTLTHIPANRGFGVGLLGNVVGDIQLDHEGNVWVATDLGLNRIAKNELSDIDSYTTPIVWQTQLNLYFPPDVVSPIVDANCRRLALHPDRDLLYIATRNGLSAFDIASLGKQTTNLETIYLYPNPIRTSRGDLTLKIGNIASEVLVEVYTLEGELVHSQNAIEAGDIVWDLTTRAGF
ncbi:MAG: hypothetical protein JSW50_12765, partial [Candidatus Latescibacterota bacterium]